MEGSTMGQVLHSSATTTQAVRRAIQNSQESLRTLAKRYGINQSKDRRKMEETYFSRWSYNRPKESSLKRVIAWRWGGNCCFSKTHFVAARRLPLCIAAEYSLSDTLVVTPLLTAAWYFTTAWGTRWSPCQEALQELPHWLLSYRHRWDANSTG